jgi:hypothetical protein
MALVVALNIKDLIFINIFNNLRRFTGGEEGIRSRHE